MERCLKGIYRKKTISRNENLDESHIHFLLNGMHRKRKATDVDELEAFRKRLRRIGKRKREAEMENLNGPFQDVILYRVINFCDQKMLGKMAMVSKQFNRVVKLAHSRWETIRAEQYLNMIAFDRHRHGIGSMECLRRAYCWTRGPTTLTTNVKFARKSKVECFDMKLTTSQLLIGSTCDMRRIAISSFNESHSVARCTKPFAVVDSKFSKKFTAMAYCGYSKTAVSGFDNGEVAVTFAQRMRNGRGNNGFIERIAEEQILAAIVKKNIVCCVTESSLNVSKICADDLAFSPAFVVRDLAHVSWCDMSRDSRIIVTADSFGFLTFYDVETGHIPVSLAQNQWQVNFPSERSVKCRFVSPNEIAINASDKVKLYDIRQRRATGEFCQLPSATDGDGRRQRARNALRTLTAVNGDYCKLLAGSRGGDVLLWDRRCGVRPTRQWNIAYQLTEKTRTERLKEEDFAIKTIEFDLSRFFTLSKYSLSSVVF